MIPRLVRRLLTEDEERIYAYVGIWGYNYRLCDSKEEDKRKGWLEVKNRIDSDHQPLMIYRKRRRGRGRKAGQNKKERRRYGIGRKKERKNIERRWKCGSRKGRE